MGLNVKHFQDETVNSKFICSHCHGVFVDPVLCNCGHIFCWVCFKRRKKRQSKCLVCSKELGVSSEALEGEWLKEIAELKIICPKGCTKVVRFELLTHHFDNECDLAFISCTNEGCTKKVKRADLPNHLTKCDFRVVSCCCGVAVRFLDLRQHQLVQKCVAKQNLQIIVRKRREMERAIREHRLTMQKQCFKEECEQRRLIKLKQRNVRSSTATSVRSEPVLGSVAKETGVARLPSSHSASGPLQRTSCSCRNCGKLYDKSNNHGRACTWHFGVSCISLYQQSSFLI